MYMYNINYFNIYILFHLFFIVLYLDIYYFILMKKYEIIQ